MRAKPMSGASARRGEERTLTVLDTRMSVHLRISSSPRDSRCGPGFAIKSTRLHAAANPFAVKVIDVPSNRVRIARIFG